ncbi:MAG: hypothetical protein M3Y23_00665, partial [Actinomycetota bacterium]|nr:hypothetical protein [Actinomycetota bacterium]
GSQTVSACTATVDGNPIQDGDALPDTPGEHTIVVTAIDNTELTRSHTHKYTVKPFEDIYNDDAPLAYYRLGDADNGPMKDSGPNHRHGTYKNAQESGGIGISGDLDRARKFFGSSGYGFVSSIPAPRFQSTIEVWANPDEHRTQSLVGHGDAGEIFTAADGTLSFRHMGTTVSTSPGLTPGRFTQVAGVWDGAKIHLYVDGELRASAEATKRPSSASTFYVGYGEISPWFKGSLDEVAYYGKALNGNRVLEHFLADPPPPVETLDQQVPAAAEPDKPVADEPAPDSPEKDTGKPVKPPVLEPSAGPQPETDAVTSPVNRPAGTKAKGNRAGLKKAKLKKAKLRKCKSLKKKARRGKCVRRVRAL